MANKLKERYLSFDVEKLNSILTSKVGTYNHEAVNIAEEVLIERGYELDVKKLYREKFKDYYDEDLVSILNSEKKEYKNEALEIITEILEKRSKNTLDSETEKLPLDELTKQALENKGVNETGSAFEKSTGISSTKKIIGIILFSLLLIIRLAKFNGSTWDFIGLIFPIAIIILLINQKSK